MSSDKVKKIETYLLKLIDEGGPIKGEFELFRRVLAEIGIMLASGNISQEEIINLRLVCKEILTTDTMQGLALNKIHGYSGDFEKIDKIYIEHKSTNPKLIKWDEFFHEQKAPIAVRNRKIYFHEILTFRKLNTEKLEVLNIASGPGRCMYDWLTKNTKSEIKFDCVELDSNAIEYAKNLNTEFLNQISFQQANILKYNTNIKYDIIWAAGILDYFNDRLFVHLISKLKNNLKQGGSLIVGNFSDNNPSKAYMEIFGNWHLIHRSREKLIQLASEAGVSPEKIEVHSEPLGANLFLHINN